VAEAADGSYRLRERLLGELRLTRERPTRPYTEVIAEVIAAKRSTAEYAERLREIEDLRLRAIAACLLADIPLSTIAELLHLSPRHLRRLIRRCPLPETS